MRCFLAIEIPADARAEVARVQEEVRQQLRHSRVTWVAPENFHITLHFLGEIDDELRERIVAGLHALTYPPSFELRLRDVHAFPHAKDPRVLIVRATTPTELLGARKRAADILAGLGVALDHRPWDAHVTIGRMNVRAEALRPEAIAVAPIAWTVQSFILMRSTLTSEGSIYEPVASFTLM